jgi:hypothetical protein
MGIYLGIDPGKTGSAARLDTMEVPLRRLTFYPMPLVNGQWDAWKMISLVQIWALNGVDQVIIERCQAFPGISAAANAAVMEAYGMWKGCLAARFRPDQIISTPPNQWKKAMGLEVPLVKAGRIATAAEKKAAYQARKDKALAVARVEFGLSFQTPGGRQLDGEAEAALIALYGSRL